MKDLCSRINYYSKDYSEVVNNKAQLENIFESLILEEFTALVSQLTNETFVFPHP